MAMDLKNALEYLFGRLKDARPVTVDVAGQAYRVAGDGTLGAPVRALEPQWTKPIFEVSTLTGFVAAVTAQIDDFPASVAAYVSDYRTVQLVSTKADEFGKRHVYIEAQHESECPFKFNEYAAPEKFQIDFRTSFYLNDEAVKVLTVVSNLESGGSISTADDGLSQKLEIKSGTLSKTPVVLPSDGIPLIPWRTFRETDPVESKFLLRLKASAAGMPCPALFEIDQKWKLDTMQSIAAWLKANLPTGLAIIA
jgi:hypothetical protein